MGLYVFNWLISVLGDWKDISIAHVITIIKSEVSTFPIVHPSPKVMADFFSDTKINMMPLSNLYHFGGCIKRMQVFIFCAKYIDFLH